MDAEQVIKKILSDAECEAEKIRKQADKKENAEKAKFSEQLAKYDEQTEILAKKAGEEKISHLLAAARMTNAKEFLAEKRKIIDDVFLQARSQILNLPDAEYQEICTKLILEAVETGDEEIIVDEKEKRINQKIVDKINELLAPKMKANLKLSAEKMPIDAGFVLKRGKIKYNVSIDVLISQARKELEIKLAKELF